jgi:hypothetical protein
LPRDVKRAYLAPQMTELPMAHDGDALSLRIPRIECHQMVVLE